MKSRFVPGAIALLLTVCAPIALADTPESEPLDPHTLARAIFPADQAANIVSLRANTPVVPGDPVSSVVLFSRPLSAAPGICRRESYHVSLPLSAEVPSSSVTRWNRIAVGVSCDAIADRDFAQIVPIDLPTEDAVAALAWLKDAVSDGSQRGSRKLALSCQDKTAPSGCKAGARKEFSALPLEKLFIVKKAGEDSWRFTIALQDGYGPVWIVLASGIKSSSPKVEMTRMLPPPV